MESGCCMEWVASKPRSDVPTPRLPCETGKAHLALRSSFSGMAESVAARELALTDLANSAIPAIVDAVSRRGRV